MSAHREVCVIVGVGPGLGLALARRFGREKFTVALVARDFKKLSGYRDELAAAGIEAHPVAADAGNIESLNQAFKEIQDTLAAPEVMIYNAVGVHPGPASTLSAKHLAQDLGVSVVGALGAARAVLPAMVERNRGTLLFTGGGAALSPWPAMASVSVGKAALRALALNLAEEFRETSVRVSTVTIYGRIQANSPFDPDRIADVFWDAHSGATAQAEFTFR